MRTILLSLLLFASSVKLIAQIKNPVTWNFSAKKITDKTFEVHIIATIEAGWHIYTLGHKGDIGVPTSITFNNNPLILLSGKLSTKAKALSMKDPSTNEIVKFYTNNADFTQVLKLKANVKTNTTGTIEYMVCNDKQCLPPTKKQFSISLQ